jgi:hypothetical protein
MVDDSQPEQPFDPIAPENAPILTQLAVRYYVLFNRRQADSAKLAEIQTRLDEDTAAMVKLKDAAVALGADPKRAGWFEPIRDAAGHDVFDQVMRGHGLNLHWPNKALPEAALTVESVPQKPELSLPATASVRDLVLERLEVAAQKGAQAADIRKSIEALRKQQLHEKTVGMTLYRLAQEGLARRDGRTWFYVSPEGETQNPGAVTPGLISREDKEGEEL